jgi:hypothetical protein
MDLIARAKKDKSLPSMHIDSKEAQSIYKGEKGSSRKRRFDDNSRRSRKSEDSFRDGSRKSGENYRDGKKQRKEKSDGKKKSGFSGKRESGSKPIHTSKTSNASLYKK